jgi:hypothetical protein
VRKTQLSGGMCVWCVFFGGWGGGELSCQLILTPGADCTEALLPHTVQVHMVALSLINTPPLLSNPYVLYPFPARLALPPGRPSPVRLLLLFHTGAPLLVVQWALSCALLGTYCVCLEGVGGGGEVGRLGKGGGQNMSVRDM